MEHSLNGRVESGGLAVSSVATHRTDVASLAAIGKPPRFQAFCLEPGCGWRDQERSSRSLAQVDAGNHARASVAR